MSDTDGIGTGLGFDLSDRTLRRIRSDIAAGDYRRINRLFERRKLFPLHGTTFEGEEGYSSRTRDRRIRDYRSGKTSAFRPDFVAWDGEGREVDSRHRYILLANSRGGNISNPDGLQTKELLEFLVKENKARTINIFYSFGYDIQQIIHDIPDVQLERLLHGHQINYSGFWLQYFPNKIFTINHYIRFYDIFNFFHTSFVKAVVGTLGKEFISPRLIEGKEARSDFSKWSIDKIAEYNKEELELLAKLGSKLRDIFDGASINIRSSYYGPGAIAKYWFTKHHIKPVKIEDDSLISILERAYFGGRFETFSLGKHSAIYECDIHSAYPAVIKDLQYVDDWVLLSPSDFQLPNLFSIWKVEWHLPNTTRVGPLPSRDKRGLISYPANGIGWYHKIEVDAALEIYPEGITILEGIGPQKIWDYPFTWVQEVFTERTRLKRNHSPAEWALKVGMNSLYGKTAQRVGTNKFFCLPWAGYITAATRAKLLRSIKGKEKSIIAFATDAVYSTTRLSNIDYGAGLGEFEVKIWDEGYFIQSGVYRLIDKRTSKDAYRGFHSKDGLEPIFQQLKENPYQNPSITQSRFVTHLEAIKFPKAMGPHRLKFVQIRKFVAPYRPTKRIVDYSSDLFIETDNPDMWIDHGDPIVESYMKASSNAPKRAKAFYEKVKIPIGIWPNYKPLLERSVETRILENMNDHRQLVYGKSELGPLEESYPFVKLLPSLEKELNGLGNEIALDRIGGAKGEILSRNDPIVNETDIAEITISNG